MRRNLAVLVCAAGCVCLAGCHRYEQTGDNSTYDHSSSFSASLHPATLNDTGTSGSSASPYTEGRPEYRYPADTGSTGSSASPNTYYRGDTRPGMVKDKSGCCGDK